MLRECGVKQAIVSNKIDYAVKRLNDTFFRMECAIGTQDGLRRKPDADMVLKAMEELGADRERTVYVGIMSGDWSRVILIASVKSLL